MNKLENEGEKAVKASAIDLRGGVKSSEGGQILQRSNGDTVGVDRV